MKSLDDELVLIMTELSKVGKIEAFPILQKIANFEHVIINSLMKGEITYLVGVNINARDGYKNPESSNYLHYEMWRDVFADIYGNVSEPPYRAVKISTVVGKKKEFSTWIATADKRISEPLLKFMKERKKDSFKQLLLPLEIVASGIPKEFLSTLDLRSTVADISAGYYIVLEMLGFYFDNKFNTQLVSDRLPYRPEFGLPGGKTAEDLLIEGLIVDEEDDDDIIEEVEDDEDD
jgi:hypothetical protein